MPAKRLIQYQITTEPFRQTEIVTEDKWHQAWSQPVKRSIAPALAVALAATSGLFAPVLNPSTQITQSFESRWHYPWSEPVRVKPQVPVAEQQFISWIARDSFAITGFIPWFEPLSEPVRFPNGLKVYLQRYLEEPPRELPPVNDTATMAATEINSDVASFGVSVYNKAAVARVSIYEIPAIRGGAAGLEET